MTRLRILLPMLALTLAACGGGGQVDAPYDVCAARDGCSGGTACIQSSLAGVFTGFFCSAGCSADSDCPQDFSNFPSICLDNACYLSCPTTNSSCPYGSTCNEFSDQTGTPTFACVP
jgi:hypothetical protein